MRKEINHDRYQTCNISKQKIDTKYDQYVILVDCIGEKTLSYKFYKIEPLKALMEGNTKEASKLMMARTMEMAGSMLEKVGLAKPKYVYEKT